MCKLIQTGLWSFVVKEALDNGGYIMKPHEIAHKVLSGSGVLKRKEAVEKVANTLRLDKTIVERSMGGWLKDMEKDNLVKHTGHGYWEF